MLKSWKLLVSFAMAASAVACAEPKIEGAYALSTDPANATGFDVRPDQFRLYAVVSSAQRMAIGDTFQSSFNVGVAGRPSKYGGSAGIGWRIVSSKPVSPALIHLPPNGFVYRAESDVLSIHCNVQNRLIYSVPGDARDKLVFSVQTAGMAQPLGVRLGYHGALLPSPPWHPNDPEQEDANYLGEKTRLFFCPTHDES